MAILLFWIFQKKTPKNSHLKPVLVKYKIFKLHAALALAISTLANDYPPGYEVLVNARHEGGAKCRCQEYVTLKYTENKWICRLGWIIISSLLTSVQGYNLYTQWSLITSHELSIVKHPVYPKITVPQYWNKIWWIIL